jgi:transposase
MDHPPYSPDLSPADFWLFPELKRLLKIKSFSNVAYIKSHVKKVCQIFLFRILKTVLKNDLSSGNIVKNFGGRLL